MRYIALIVVVAVVVIALIAFAARRRSAGRRRQLPPGAVERFAASWQQIQARFVDQPQQAVAEADRLATEVLAARGAGDRVPDRLTRAREAAATGSDQTSMTEGLRRAMLEYRALMDELLGRAAGTATRREVA